MKLQPEKESCLFRDLKYGELFLIEGSKDKVWCRTPKADMYQYNNRFSQDGGFCTAVCVHGGAGKEAYMQCYPEAECIRLHLEGPIGHPGCRHLEAQGETGHSLDGQDGPEKNTGKEVLEDRTAYACPKCGAKAFTVTAHVTQDWRIDGNKNFLECLDDCVQVTHEPVEEDIWACDGCGYEGPGYEFHVPDHPAEGPDNKTEISFAFVSGKKTMEIGMAELLEKLGIKDPDQVTGIHMKVRNKDGALVAATDPKEQEYPGLYVDGKDADGEPLNLGNFELPNSSYPGRIASRLYAGYEAFETDSPIALIFHEINTELREQRTDLVNRRRQPLSKNIYVDYQFATAQSWGEGVDLSEHAG